ncbi:hypothetical protein HU200_015912 [Digitaria exilis]|uniref:F-box domain-containing protein n=2 Tax=Digitaria exilis TaxID=1010633 RepID=A0A835F8K0_9POAL|nr:hypothetical protein HU200_015912 [Digitaria exilis]
MVVLMEELVEEILLRFPPTEPASLVRAALVCKPWCRLISGRRFSEVHRSPPMLGYFCNLYPDAGNPNRNKDAGPVSRFFPASAAYPRHPDQANWSALDARHGRVLLRSVRGHPRISVWDPVTGERWELPPLSDAWYEDDEDRMPRCSAPPPVAAAAATTSTAAASPSSSSVLDPAALR